MAAEQQERSDTYWGTCPECGLGANYITNIGRNPWAVCETDKRMWWVGSNLFSDWREETKETWEERARQFAEGGYQVVTPPSKPAPETDPDDFLKPF